ncbi:hypothetical protein DL767_003287 [Monosporascus sp. MG133]|nr:hypothetical protein DL767_003287 [Monosporascus sp. MG133]
MRAARVPSPKGMPTPRPTFIYCSLLGGGSELNAFALREGLAVVTLAATSMAKISAEGSSQQLWDLSPQQYELSPEHAAGTYGSISQTLANFYEGYCAATLSPAEAYDARDLMRSTSDQAEYAEGGEEPLVDVVGLLTQNGNSLGLGNHRALLGSTT